MTLVSRPAGYSSCNTSQTDCCRLNQIQIVTIAISQSTILGVHLFYREKWVYFVKFTYWLRFNPSVKQGENEMMLFENGKRKASRIVVNVVIKKSLV